MRRERECHFESPLLFSSLTGTIFTVRVVRALPSGRHTTPPSAVTAAPEWPMRMRDGDEETAAADDGAEASERGRIYPCLLLLQVAGLLTLLSPWLGTRHLTTFLEPIFGFWHHGGSTLVNPETTYLFLRVNILQSKFGGNCGCGRETDFPIHQCTCTVLGTRCLFPLHPLPSCFFRQIPSRFFMNSVGRSDESSNCAVARSLAHPPRKKDVCS